MGGGLEGAGGLVRVSWLVAAAGGFLTGGLVEAGRLIGVDVLDGKHDRHGSGVGLKMKLTVTDLGGEDGRALLLL